MNILAQMIVQDLEPDNGMMEIMTSWPEIDKHEPGVTLGDMIQINPELATNPEIYKFFVLEIERRLR